MQSGPFSHKNYAIFKNALSEALAKESLEGALSLIDDKFIDYDLEQIVSKATAALMWAASNGHPEMVQHLLQDARVDPAYYNCAFRIAACHGHPDVIKVFLEMAAKAQFSITANIYNGLTYPLRHFIAPNFNPADGENCAISQAAQNGHIKVVELLIGEPRIKLSAKRKAARKVAAGGFIFLEKHPETFKVFLEDPTVERCLKTHYVTSAMNRIDPDEFIKYLLTDVNLTSQDLFRLLQYAASHSHFKSVELLLNDPKLKSHIVSHFSDKKNKHLLELLILDSPVLTGKEKASVNGFIPWNLINEDLELLIVFIKHYPFILNILTKKLTEFVRTNENVKNTLISPQTTNACNFRKAFFELILKEFFDKMPQAVAALKSQNLPDELICYISSAIHPLFQIYNERERKPEIVIEMKPDQIYLPLFGTMSKPIEQRPENEDIGMDVEDEKRYLAMWF